MEQYRKMLVELVSSVLMIAALFVPQAGLVTVDEVNAFAGSLLSLAIVGGPVLVWAIPNAKGWIGKVGTGPNLAIYRKAIVSGLMTLLTLVSMFAPSIGFVTEGHVSAAVGIVVVLVSLFGSFFVWRVPNAPA